MMCPKCQIGGLREIQFVHTGKRATACEYCEALWFSDEEINEHTGHSLKSFSAADIEDYITDHEVKGQDSLPVAFFPKR